MDNLLQLAMQMILCLVIAAIIGAIIGYLLGKIGKCNKNENNVEDPNKVSQKELHDYEQKALPPKETKETKNYIASVTDNTEDKTQLHHKTLSETIQNELHEENSKSVNATPKNTQAVLKTFDGIEGIRPKLLSEPRNGNADDLKEISGIGLKIEEALNEVGIFHFNQIASWSSDNAKWIDNYLVFKGRVIREDWIGQAKLLAAGGSTEFSRKIKKGDK